MWSKLFDELTIDLDSPEHARLWTEALNVSLPTLLLAMSKVGTRLNDIREELGMARIYIFPRGDEIPLSLQRALRE